MKTLGPVLLLVLAGCAADEYQAERQERARQIADDVELVGCEPTDLGYLGSEVRVTNLSSERSNYFVEVAFSTPDGTEQLDTATATVHALKPDQAATETANSYQVEADGGYECEVIDITRYTDEP